MLRFDQMTLDQAAALAGESKMATSMWLRSCGYVVYDNEISCPPTAQEREAEAYRIRATAAFDRPCVRCGAARGCAHRSLAA